MGHWSHTAARVPIPRCLHEDQPLPQDLLDNPQGPHAAKPVKNACQIPLPLQLLPQNLHPTQRILHLHLIILKDPSKAMVHNKALEQIPRKGNLDLQQAGIDPPKTKIVHGGQLVYY